MTLTTTLKASLAVACVVAFAGCTDLKPVQAQIDDLKAQVSKLQGDTAKASSEAAAAQSAASGAQSTANQALSTGQSNSTAIEAINEKIDRMFKKSVSK